MRADFKHLLSDAGEWPWGKVAGTLMVFLIGWTKAFTAQVTVPMYDIPPALPELADGAKRFGLDTKEVRGGAVDRPQLKAGDALTGIVNLEDDDTLKQWVFRLEVGELNEKEKKLAPLRTLTLHTSIGDRFEFGGARVAMMVQVVGPWTKKGKAAKASDAGVKDRRQRFLVNADYLALGFDRAAEAAMTLGKLARESERKGFHFSFGPKVFPPDEVAKVRAAAGADELTPERQRAIIASQIALPEFLRVIVAAPGFAEILKSMVDVPWMSLIGSGGKLKPRFEQLYNLAQSMPVSPESEKAGLRVYAFPVVLLLNDKPALACTLFARDPKPPFLASAGVLAVEATAPDGKGPRLSLFVVRGDKAPEPPLSAQVERP